MARIERVNQQLKREISMILQRDLADPRFQFITITAVEVSKDLRYAKVHFSVLGNPQQVKSAQEGLDKAGRMIRRLVAQKVDIRYTPEFKFYYDKSLEMSSQIDKALQEIKDEMEKNNSAHQKE